MSQNRELKEKLEERLIAQFSKYTYYVLAIDASLIAYTLKQTETLSYSYWLIPMGLAVLCWLLSFYWGVVFLNVNMNKTSIRHTLYSNDDIFIQHPELSERYKETDKKITNRLNKTSKRYTNFMFLGGIFYVLWHLFKLYINTYCV